LATSSPHPELDYVRGGRFDDAPQFGRPLIQRVPFFGFVAVKVVNGVNAPLPMPNHKLSDELAHAQAR
jgi:hypothetical protein